MQIHLVVLGKDLKGLDKAIWSIGQDSFQKELGAPSDISNDFIPA